MAPKDKPTGPQRCLLESIARLGTADRAAVFADCGLRGGALTRVLDACQRRGWITSRDKLTRAGQKIVRGAA